MLTKRQIQAHIKNRKVILLMLAGCDDNIAAIASTYHCVRFTFVRHSTMTLLLFLAVVELVVGDSSPLNIFDTNLVVNGDASNGVHGWSNVGDTLATTCSYTGATTFCGGRNVVSIPTSGYNSILRQIVYFTSAPLTTWKLIDNGNRVFMDLSGRLGGYWYYSDWATLTVFQENTAGQVLKQTVIGPVTPSDRGDSTIVMYREAKHIAVARGTRQFRIEFYSYMATTGYDIDGNGVDFNVVLRVRAPLTKTIVTLSKTRATHSVKPTVSTSPTAPQGSKSVSSSDAVSQSRSHSCTLSLTSTSSISNTTSLSTSVTTSQFVSSTLTNSSTPSQTATSTRSFSPSYTNSSSPSYTASPSNSTSQSDSTSESTSATSTNSNSSSPSESASLSSSFSATLSSTAELSGSSTLSASNSSSLSLTATVTPSIDLLFDVPLTVVEVSSNVAVFTSVAAGVLISPAAVACAATQIAMQLCSCTLPHPDAVAATDPTTFLLSPFFQLGFATVALGNVGLMIAVVACHYLVVMLQVCLLRRRSTAAALTVVSSDSSHFNPSKGSTSGEVAMMERYMREVRTKLKFPHWSLVFCLFWMHGAAFGAGRYIQQTSVGYRPFAIDGPSHGQSLTAQPASIGIAAACMLVVLAPMGVVLYVKWKHVHAKAFVSSNPRHVGIGVIMDPAVVRGRWFAFAVPTEAWGPESTRSCYGALCNSAASRDVLWWSSVEAVGAPLATLLLATAAPVSGQYCPVTHYVVSFLFAAFAAVTIVFWPHRLPLKSPLSSISYVLLSLTCFAQSGAFPPLVDISPSLTLMQGLLQLVGLLYDFAIWWSAKKWPAPFVDDDFADPLVAVPCAEDDDLALSNLSGVDEEEMCDEPVMVRREDIAVALMSIEAVFRVPSSPNKKVSDDSAISRPSSSNSSSSSSSCSSSGRASSVKSSSHRTSDSPSSVQKVPAEPESPFLFSANDDGALFLGPPTVHSFDHPEATPLNSIKDVSAWRKRQPTVTSAVRNFSITSEVLSSRTTYVASKCPPLAELPSSGIDL